MTKGGYREEVLNGILAHLFDEQGVLSAFVLRKAMKGILPEAVLAEVDCHCRGEKDLRLTLWSWVNLELWFRQMIDSPPRPPAAAPVLP